MVAYTVYLLTSAVQVKFIRSKTGTTTDAFVVNCHLECERSPSSERSLPRRYPLLFSTCTSISPFRDVRSAGMHVHPRACVCSCVSA
eukprot:6175145-Pleurochrysis_carterae.AAC.1